LPETEFRWFRDRLDRFDKALSDLERWKGEVDRELGVREEQMKQLGADMAATKAIAEGVRKVLIQFAFTLAGSAVVFAFSVLLATGKIGG
jgi:hypothetical protein